MDKTKEPVQGDLDDQLLPLVTEEETQITVKGHGITLADLQQRTDRALAVMDARVEILQKLRAAAIRSTDPAHWVLSKDKEGNEYGMLKASGAYTLIDLLGVSITGLRGPDGQPVSEPVLIKEDDGTKTAVIIGDVHSGFTNKTFEGVRAQRNSGEKFVGRGGIESTSQAVADGDLKSAARTLLDSKAIRICSATSQVPLRVLEHYGIDPSKCVKGHGYGSGSDRRAKDAVAANPELAEKAEAFWKVLLGYALGDTAEATKVLQECSGFKTTDGTTKQANTVQELIRSGKDKWLTKTRERFEAKVRSEEGGNE